MTLVDDLIRQFFGTGNAPRVKIGQAQSVTVGTGTTQFTTAGEEIFEVYYSGAQITVRFDGGDPHLGGIPRFPDTSEVLNRAEMAGWRGTRSGAVDGTVFWHSFTM